MFGVDDGAFYRSRKKRSVDDLLKFDDGDSTTSNSSVEGESVMHLDVASQGGGHEVPSSSGYKYCNLESYGNLTPFADLRGTLLVIRRLRSRYFYAPTPQGGGEGA